MTTTPAKPTTTAAQARSIGNQISPFHIIVQMVMESARHNYLAARVWAGLCLVSCAIFGPLEWTYDMAPTLAWLQAHGVSLQATMAAAYGQAIGASLLLILPLVVKGLTAQLAPQIKAMGIGFLAAELFDTVTNWDAAWSLFYSFAPQWQAPGPASPDATGAWPTAPVEVAGAWLGFIVTLIVTTSLFQVLFVGSALCLVVALFNSFKSKIVGWLAVAVLVLIALWWIASLG